MGPSLQCASLAQGRHSDSSLFSQLFLPAAWLQPSVGQQPLPQSVPWAGNPLHSVPKVSLSGCNCIMTRFFLLKSKYNDIVINNFNNNGNLGGLKSYSQLFFLTSLI